MKQMIVKHKKSSTVVNGLPKLPEATAIDYGEIAVNFAAGYETLSLKNSSNEVVTFSSDNHDHLISITYSELVSLRDNGKLVPGRNYRITDYECTTTQDDTQSAGNRFDIIVIADSETTLNENARAIKHEGDTYFVNANLSAWKLQYCLDNDTTRFLWADSENGKGVIYHMIDDWNNDVPYDFKNIQFKRYKVTKNANAVGLDSLDGQYIGFNGEMTGFTKSEDAPYIWAYTFTYYDGSNYNDLSVMDNYDDSVVYDGGAKRRMENNIIGPTFATGAFDDDFQINLLWALNNIVFMITNSEQGHYGTILDNVVGNYCFKMTFFGQSERNVIESDNRRLIFGSICRDNHIMSGGYGNTFGKECYFNTIGHSATLNVFGELCVMNKFGDGCGSNTFGNDCRNNTLGGGCGSNTLGSQCIGNNLGSDCIRNTFGDSCNGNRLAYGCRSNSFGTSCEANNLNGGCENNVFGDNSGANILGASSQNNIFGETCTSNHLGNGAQNNEFANDSWFNTLGDFCLGNKLRTSGCMSNSFGNFCTTNELTGVWTNSTFGSACSNNSINLAYAAYIDIESGNSGVNFTLTDGIEATYSNPVQNITVRKNTNPSSAIVIDAVGQPYEITYANDTSGEITKIVV